MADFTASLGYGPLQGLPIAWSKPDLTTTPTKVVLPTLTDKSRRPAGVKVRIVNGHASNNLAYTLVKNGATAPTITADFVLATAAIQVPPLSVDSFCLTWGNISSTDPSTPWFDLYVVASAASTFVNVTWDVIY